MNKEYGESNMDVFLNRAAVTVALFGLSMLLLWITLAAWFRSRGGTFGEGFLDSSADGYRIVVAVGLILAGGLIYSFGAIGRALGEVVLAGILWLVAAWYSNYFVLSEVRGFWQVMDAAVFGMIFLIALALFINLTYYLFALLTHRLRSPSHAK